MNLISYVATSQSPNYLTDTVRSRLPRCYRRIRRLDRLRYVVSQRSQLCFRLSILRLHHRSRLSSHLCTYMHRNLSYHCQSIALPCSPRYRFAPRLVLILLPRPTRTPFVMCVPFLSIYPLYPLTIPQEDPPAYLTNPWYRGPDQYDDLPDN